MTAAKDFQANQVAEKKARADEQKAKEKEQERLAKEERKAKEREAKKAARAEAARKAREAKQQDRLNEANAQIRRPRKNQAAMEVDETDPGSLQASLPFKFQATVDHDLDTFIQAIVLGQARQACVGRIRTGIMKKVLTTDGRCPKDGLVSWSKFINKAG